jgi:hypothetical protein
MNGRSAFELRGNERSGRGVAWHRDYSENRHCPAIATRGRQRHRPAVFLTRISPPLGTLSSGCDLYTIGFGRLRMTPRDRSLPGYVRRVAQSGLTHPAGLGILLNGRVIRARISTLALRHEPGSKSPREESKRRPCVCSLHSLRMEQEHVESRQVRYAQK